VSEAGLLQLEKAADYCRSSDQLQISELLGMIEASFYQRLQCLAVQIVSWALKMAKEMMILKQRRTLTS